MLVSLSQHLYYMLWKKGRNLIIKKGGLLDRPSRFRSKIFYADLPIMRFIMLKKFIA